MSLPARKPPKFPLQLRELQAMSTIAQGRELPARPGVAKTATAIAASRLIRRLPVDAERAVLRPQQLLHHAHLDAQRQVAPSGIGLDSADVRRRMVRRLQMGGVVSDAVLQAMAAVPRHLFVDAALVTQAYEDTSLPIGHGQTISKPSIVARMIELLMAGATASRLQGLGNLLEIGTGCGYQAAVLSVLARQVVSIERLRPLHDKARTLLAPLRPPNLRLVHGDGMRGHPPNAPYDSIIAAAGGDELPPAWLEQLAIGGRLVAPLRQAGGPGQVLMVVDRTEQGWVRSVCEAVRFVPLKSGLIA